MRVGQASPLLLLLAPYLVSAVKDDLLREPKAVLTNEEILALNHATKDALKSEPIAGPAVDPKQSGKKYKGTEDAPVDGMDGKPHAGPFVDSKAEESKAAVAGADATSIAKARPTSLDNFASTGKNGWKVEDIPERNDGVMNDEGRLAPKKGTTGTEGGISEKEKEAKTGPKPERKPQEPKEAPPLPHSEQEAIEEVQGKSQGKTKGKTSQTKTSKDGETGSKKTDEEYGAGGFEMEKPDDLPDKPHNKGTSSRGTPRDAGPPVDDPTDGNSWLQNTMPYTEGGQNPRLPKLDAAGQPIVDEGWHEWFHSFVLSFTMIIFSEIGDKTFLVAALMAMRHPRILVFSAAFGALIVMTILSAVLGHAVPTLLPKRLTTLAAAVLFFVFGARMLHEGLAMDKDLGVGEEMREVEAELEEKEQHMARHGRRGSGALESGRFKASELSPPSSRSPSPSKRSTKDRLSGLSNLLGLVLSPAWVQTFIMTFLGEWGDRSQIATIAMAAGQDYWWVTAGAIAGHGICTGMAVIGGRALAGRVSMRVVTIGGALAFLVFGVIYTVECITDA